MLNIDRSDREDIAVLALEGSLGAHTCGQGDEGGEGQNTQIGARHVQGLSHLGHKLIEQPFQSPEAGSATVFIERFHTHMPRRKRLRTDNFREKLFGTRITMKHVVLSAFFIVDDKLHRNPGLIRPLGRRRVLAVALHVSWVIHRKKKLTTTKRSAMTSRAQCTPRA